ncbi:MAG: PEGA domain-containing protein [Planctomycetota bacterium]|jgi:hypothetical protein
MGKRNFVVLNVLSLVTFTSLSGCVERKLTINTEPQGAMVVLNDEEIGNSPVTVSFEWYGDYNVAIRKDGFETLKTHRKLKAPWYDGFPFDFFANTLNPDRIVDEFEWTFELEPKKDISRKELIHNAEDLKKQL